MKVMDIEELNTIIQTCKETSRCRARREDNRVAKAASKKHLAQATKTIQNLAKNPAIMQWLRHIFATEREKSAHTKSLKVGIEIRNIKGRMCVSRTLVLREVPYPTGFLQVLLEAFEANGSFENFRISLAIIHQRVHVDAQGYREMIKWHEHIAIGNFVIRLARPAVFVEILYNLFGEPPPSTPTAI